MSNWPIANAAEPIFIGSAAQPNVSVVLVSPTTTTPSEWVEITSATPVVSSAIHVAMRFPQEQRSLVEIGLGAAGSELVIAQLPIVPQGNRNTATGPNHHSQTHVLPLSIPAGVRLAARVTCSQGNANSIHLTTHLQPASPLLPTGFARMATYGVTAGLLLTNVSASGTSFGAWVEIVASAPFPVRGLMMLGNLGNDSGTASSGSRVEFQLGIGPAGSESARLSRSNGAFAGTVTSSYWGPLVYCSYPQGTRMALRCRVEQGNLWGQSGGLILFG